MPRSVAGLNLILPATFELDHSTEEVVIVLFHLHLS